MIAARRSLILLIFLTNLTGCSTWSGFLKDISIAPTKRAPLVLPKIDQVTMDNIQWYVVTKENIQSILNRIEKDGNDPVIFGLSDSGYESLSINQAKTLRLIQQQQEVIRALRDYYEEAPNE